jgi:tetratricopeptide (TPR) repeat protein
LTLRGTTEAIEVRVEDLARRLKVARRKSTWAIDPEQPDDETCAGAVFLVGAGCSISAGIPLAAQIAQDCAKEIAQSLSGQTFRSANRALKWLQDNRHLSKRTSGTVWSECYTEIFDKFFRSSVEQRSIIQRAIAQGKNRINWAHVCLGELVDHHFVHTVLTTNFDQLVLRGIILAGRVPVVADGAEAVNRVSSRPNTPQVVHLHGSMHTYNPRNSQRGMMDAGQHPAMQATMLSVLHDTPLLVVVGYAGGEDGFIQNLRAAVDANPELEIYWVLHENCVSVLRDDVRDILTGPNKYYICGQDADLFFSDLMRMLKLQPGWMADLLAVSDVRLKALEHLRQPEIALAVRGYRSRVDELRRQPAPAQTDDALIEQAAMESLSGQDERVLSIVPAALADRNADAARLRGISLRRLGDSDPSGERLHDAAAAWEICTKLKPDGEAFLNLGRVEHELALKHEDDPRGVPHFNAAMDALTQAVARCATASALLRFSSRMELADVTFNFGSEGADAPAIERALQGLRRELRDGRYAPASSKRAEIQDLIGTLHLMRARRLDDGADYEAAVKAARAAAEGAWSSMRTSKAVGGLRHLADAYMRHGIWTATSNPRAGLNSLAKAVETFERVLAAYDSDLADAGATELHLARQSAEEELEEAREQILRIESIPAPDKRRRVTEITVLG